MRDVQAKLDELTNRLHRIRRELSRIPERKEKLEAVFNELRAEWPAMLAKQAIGELSEEQLSEFRQELALADRNRRELTELERGLLQMEQVTLKLMKPLQRKKQRTESERQYDELKARLEAGNYNRDEIEKFRQVAHELSYDKEASELLRRIEHVRNREMTFDQIYGLKPQAEGGLKNAI